jgi:hypothetical protein
MPTPQTSTFIGKAAARYAAHVPSSARRRLDRPHVLAGARTGREKGHGHPGWAPARRAAL